MRAVLQSGNRGAIVALVKEAVMYDTSIGSMLMVVLFVCVALALATRYQTEHPLHDLRRWFDAHHWLGRRHRH